MSFIIYDITFLVVFTLLVAVFLYANRKNLKREGLLYLYRTKLGLKIIDIFSKKYSSLLKPMQYFIVGSGYFMMLFMLCLVARFAYFYVTSPFAAKALKVPVVMPLIPYLPEIFKIDYLPPFYFTYWIIIIAIIAIPHEFAHGIFARLNKVKILSTGFGFLGPFLAAFVEQDEKQMKKAKKFPQLSILAAGAFANIIVALIFGLLLWIFFAAAFTPAGISFNTYSLSFIDKSSVSAVGFASAETPENFTYALVLAGNATYFASAEMLSYLSSNTTEKIPVFDDSPAFRAKLTGAISEINGIKITSYGKLNQTLMSFSPGDNVTIKTIGKSNEEKEYSITLGERNSRPFLGIGIIPQQSSGFLSKFFVLLAKIKDPSVYYASKIGNLGIFIFNLLWWIFVISISVALMNMLPAGMFDGGRFFYLTIWGITKSEKIAKVSFKIMTYFLLGILALLIAKWFFAVF